MSTHTLLTTYDITKIMVARAEDRENAIRNLMRMNPGWTKEQAEEKADLILAPA